LNKFRYLLFQVRKREDPMRAQEVRCFSRALKCKSRQIEVLDLIHEGPTPYQLRHADVILMGGSGNYSVTEGGEWLKRSLEAMRKLYRMGKPTFGSCWGFQAMSKALGGEVITDINRAEVGTAEIDLTDQGSQDPIMSPLGSRFLAFEGHQDIVTRLPKDATLLAVSGDGIYQSFTFPEKPIYCTQFHPELDLPSFLQRVDQYPEYVERVVGVPLEVFASGCEETPKAGELLVRFVRHVFDLTS